jgi:hypothetical protein
LNSGKGLVLKRGNGSTQEWLVGITGSTFKVTDVTASNADRLAITSTGKVGIGTIAPNSQLDVVAPNDASESGAQMIVKAPQIGSDQYILFKSHWSANNRTAGFAHIGFNDVGNGRGKLWFGTSGFSNDPANMPVKRMWIDDGGNVGIGTQSSTASGETFRLSVDGKVRAREVVVNSDAWADYVFDETYRNAPLNEVEAHIKEHKHLPGIPAAKEISEKGVNVGQMQALLLEKIEELTLHMIAQEKRIKRLEEENASLRGTR